MSWLVAAYGAVVMAIALYLARLAALRRRLNAEIDAMERRR
jgi:CcmD family protein